MATTVTHAFVSAVADGADATLVRPSNWNAAHTVSTSFDEPIQGQDLAILGSQNLNLESLNNLLFTAAALLVGLNSSYELQGLVPNGHFRLHYRNAIVSAMNNLTLEGSADLVALDLVPGSNLDLKGKG